MAFSEAMSGAQVSVALGLCDLTGVDLLVDVGGGSGGLVAAALARYAGLRGVLLELPEAARQAKATVTDAAHGLSSADAWSFSLTNPHVFVGIGS